MKVTQQEKIAEVQYGADTYPVHKVIGEQIEVQNKRIKDLETERETLMQMAKERAEKNVTLTGAILWALGCGPDDFPARQENQGPYWWRSGLRLRSGVEPAAPAEVVR